MMAFSTLCGNAVLVILFYITVTLVHGDDHDFVSMPGGKLHKKCVVALDEEFTYDNGLIKTASGKHILADDNETNYFCAKNSLNNNRRWRYLKEESNYTVYDDNNYSYYSGWVAYAGYTHAHEFDSFSSIFTVPPAPPATKHITHLFFFNGIEDNAGPSLILQPVLQYGSSGCGGIYRYR